MTTTTTTVNDDKILAPQPPQSRSDGRNSANTLRPLSCQLSCLHQADGSALWKSGATQVLCAVHGPLAPRVASQEDAQQTTLVVLYADEPSLEPILSRALQACVVLSDYPKTVLQIVLQTIQHDGSVLSCAVHAAACALMDAGVSMYCMPIATTCCCFLDDDITTKKNKANDGVGIYLDPNKEEEEEVMLGGSNPDDDGIAAIGSSSIVTYIQTSTRTDKDHGRVLATVMEVGSLSLESLLKCEEVASRASTAVVAFMRLAIEQKVTRQSQTLFSTYTT